MTYLISFQPGVVQACSATSVSAQLSFRSRFLHSAELSSALTFFRLLIFHILSYVQKLVPRGNFFPDQAFSFSSHSATLVCHKNQVSFLSYPQPCVRLSTQEKKSVLSYLFFSFLSSFSFFFFFLTHSLTHSRLRPARAAVCRRPSSRRTPPCLPGR